MSETTPGETPVERRLREMARILRAEANALDATTRYAMMTLHVSDADRFDAGREALELLRKWRGPETWDWRMARKALLARCEGDR